MWELIKKLDFIIYVGLIVAATYFIVTLRLIIYQLRHFRKLGSLRAILFLAISSLAQALIANITSPSFRGRNTHIIEISDTVYTLLELIILQLVYYSILKEKWLRNFLITTISISVLVSAISLMDRFQFLEFHFSELILVSGLLMLFISFNSYHQIVNTDYIIDIKSSHWFWFTTAVFFLNSISLPLFFFRDYLTKGNQAAIKLAYINAIGIIYYIVFFSLLNTASKCKVESLK